MSDAYLIHVNYDDLLSEIAKLRNVDRDLSERLASFVASLHQVTLKLEPALTRESHEDEHELWQEYTQLQREKLLLLDLSHEYDYMEDKVKAINPGVDVMVREAVEELSEHVAVLAETHRAHIDILGIKNARRLSIGAIVVSATIAYLAVWEYTFREFINGIDFPMGLSPGLNYALAMLTILPVFAAIAWSIRNRRASV